MNSKCQGELSGTSAASKSADCVTLNKEYAVVYHAKNDAELTYAILVKMYPSRVSAQYTFGKRVETFKNGLVLRQAS